MLIEQDAGTQVLKSADGQVLVAREGNQQALQILAESLLEQNLIRGYQLFKFVGSPKNNVQSQKL